MSPERADLDPERHFRDGRGVSWRVREVDASELRSPYGAHCLIFVSDAAGRRVWDFPTDWRELSDDALEKLSWGR